MTQRTVYIPEIGEVILAKRRGSTNLRISINAAGKVRVGMPHWAPYATGIAFARSKVLWIKKHLTLHATDLLTEGDLIGKAHRIRFIFSPDAQKISTKVTTNSVLITSSYPYDDEKVQKKAFTACERALNSEARHLLPQRLSVLAKRHNFSYNNVSVRKLISRWGSCSSKKDITLSYYLIQLPWHLVDYVLLHELMHTNHLNHSKEFWSDFEEILPNLKSLRKEIRTYRPKVKPHRF